MTMKSVSCVILNDLISGTAIRTFGFPVSSGILASKSPNARET